MEELKELLESCLDGELLHIVVSGQKTKDSIQKIKVRPLLHRGALVFQAALWDGKKEFHKNYERQEMISALLVWMSRDFKQMQIDTTAQSASVLVSKKGKVTIRVRTCSQKRQQADLSHNRTKTYLIPEGTPVPFLVKLGVMTPEGKVVRAKYDKFRQINRFLEFIEDVCPVLDRGRELTMIDFGCGKSYLTFAIYYYLHDLRGYDLRIIGLDLKEDVIENCSRLAAEFGYDKLQFLAGDIADFEGVTQVDLVVTLHACDTATDFALAKAVGWNAKAILSVPCCQHELNGQIENEVLAPVLKYGLLKERMAALITDGLRAELLEEAGYRVQVLEFIDMEHTPKNILIRAVREKSAVQKIAVGAKRGAAEKTPAETNQPTAENAPAETNQPAAENVPAAQKQPSAEAAPAASALQTCMDFLHVRPTLAALLAQQSAATKVSAQPPVRPQSGTPKASAQPPIRAHSAARKPPASPRAASPGQYAAASAADCGLDTSKSAPKKQETIDRCETDYQR